MTDRDRVLAYVAALVVAFVLAFLVGRIAAPQVGGSEPSGQHHAVSISLVPR